MNSSLISGNLTLEEKLSIIDKEMKKLQNKENEIAKSQGRAPIPIDPADALQCDGCQ